MLVGKVVLILLSGPVVAMAAILVGQLYALIALLALPFLLAFEVIDRKIRDAHLAGRELDMLQSLLSIAPARIRSAVQEHKAEDSVQLAFTSAP
ncbi:hypothetical protein [Variovorax sp. CF079]|uniref:hypothetical protein n=1 Tax=Variovorax sp. CF079 TaxID=1882774 RepID=UPI000B8229EE|nr:hypothetical protein [Variovorax sp. CF079]